MQGLTHIAAGLIVTIVVWHAIPETADRRNGGFDKVLVLKGHGITPRHFTRVAAIYVMSIWSHYVFDDLARFTYHPHGSVADWGNVIFTVWTLGNIAVITPAVLFAAIAKNPRYIWGIFGSIVIDLWDWGFARMVNAIAGIIVLPEAILHSAPRLLDTWLAGTPDFRNLQWAIFVEIGIMGCLLLAWFLLKRKWTLPGKWLGSRPLTIVLAIGVGITTGTVLSLILIPIYPWW
nr:hypothetical protein [Candidatus Sigynarchaeota archaeon]